MTPRAGSPRCHPGTGSALNYGFDSSGNLAILPTGAAGTYDHDSELTSNVLGSTTITYTYNAGGQRLTAAHGSTNAASGTWNGASELTSYDNGAADMSTASYDGDGLRASAVATPSGGSATTQNFVWNTDAQVPQLLMDSANAYIYAGAQTPAEQVNLASGTNSYLVADSLGSVRGTVNNSGTLTGGTSYDAWGNPETPGGLTGTTPFGFAGGYTDPTGLIYLIDRYYDPQSGQFTSIDPLVGQTLEPYLYAGDNPVSETDPTGALHTKPHCVAHFRRKCVWADGIDFFFTYKFTYALATTGVIVFVPVILVIHRLIVKYFGKWNPLDGWIKEKFDKGLEAAYKEARDIVGTTKEEQENYLTRKNKSCLVMSVQVISLVPHIYSNSYKAPKEWCIG
jgi:RHS repeat-associated protein